MTVNYCYIYKLFLLKFVNNSGKITMGIADTLNAGIVGYGKSAKTFHAPLINAAGGLTFRMALERSGNSAAEEYPGVTVVQDIDDMLKSREIDLVVITTPNHLHFSQAYKALEAGKHVVVEKPFTITSSEAKELMVLAGKKNKIITVFQNRRWDGDFLTVKEIVKEKKVGRLVEFESTFNRFRNYLRPDAWKEKNLPGSGILYDLGPHLIDQVFELFGFPDSLYADIRNQRGGDADDYFELDLYYKDLKVKLKAGMLVPFETPRFVLRGVKGSFRKFGMDPQEDDLIARKNPLNDEWGKEDESRWGQLKTMENDSLHETIIETIPGAYRLFYNDLVNAIRDNKEPLVKPEDAAAVIRCIELAIESNAGSRAVLFGV
jgi:predicted dehydrogenase